MCTDDEDVEELLEMYGPLCRHGCDNDQGGFDKLMWYEIMKEFNCKATSTWSCCDEVYIHDDVHLLDTWDHYLLYAMIHENDAQNNSLGRRKRRNGQDGGQ